MDQDSIFIPNHDPSLRLVRFTVHDDPNDPAIIEFFPLIAWHIWDSSLHGIRYLTRPITTIGRVTGEMDENGVCFGLVMSDGRVTFLDEDGEWFDDVSHAARAAARHWRSWKSDEE